MPGKAVIAQKTVMPGKAVMPGHDPASMNSGSWIAGQARNDSVFRSDSLLRNDSVFRSDSLLRNDSLFRNDSLLLQVQANLSLLRKQWPKAC